MTTSISHKRARENEEAPPRNIKSYNGHTVSFPQFSALEPEIQALIGRHCDESTRLSLYLTCKTFYYTPVSDYWLSRPRILRGAFAKDAMWEGNEELVRFGIEMLGINKAAFAKHILKAAKRNHKKVFAIMRELNFKLYVFHFRKALLYATKNNKLTEYRWIKKFIPVEYKELIKLGYIITSNLKELIKFNIASGETIVFSQEIVLQSANCETIQWLVENRLLVNVATQSFQYIGKNREARDVYSFLNQTFPHNQNLFYFKFGVIKYDNLEVLACFDFKIDPILSHNTFDLILALNCGSFKVFRHLIQSVPWDFPIVNLKPEEKTLKKNPKWLEQVRFELDADPADIGCLVARGYGTLALLKEFFWKLDPRKINFWDLVKMAPSNEKDQIIEFLIKNAAAHMTQVHVINIIMSPDCSYSQRKRLLDLPWATKSQLELLLRFIKEDSEDVLRAVRKKLASLEKQSGDLMQLEEKNVGTDTKTTIS